MKSILLADDEINLRLLVRATIESPEYRILEAPDGPTALHIARAEAPDIAVLDWMMPGLTGVEVVRALKSDPRTAGIPVVMLTAKGGQVDREEGRSAGVSAYLTKPFSPVELLEKVRELLPANGSSSTPVSPAATSVASTDSEIQLDMTLSQLRAYSRDLRAAIDAERQRAQELEKANARLQLLDRLKMSFLGFISHELRTPLQQLTAINMLDLVQDPAEEAELQEIMRNGYARLEKFVTTGLEYFRWLATDRIEVDAVVDLRVVASAVAERLTASADGRADARLTVPAEPCLVRSQEEHLRRVVETLLDNARKFSDRVSPVLIDLCKRGNQVVLTVSDSGRGFPPQLAAELFQPFTIGDQMGHQRGTGLNLAISRAIVETYGGYISAASDGFGHGATFTVELPAAGVAAVGEDEKKSPTRAKRGIVAPSGTRAAVRSAR